MRGHTGVPGPPSVRGAALNPAVLPSLGIVSITALYSAGPAEPTASAISAQGRSCCLRSLKSRQIQRCFPLRPLRACWGPMRFVPFSCFVVTVRAPALHSL